MDTQSRTVLEAVRTLSTGVIGMAVEAHRIAMETHLSEGQVVVALKELEAEGLASPCAIGGQLTSAGAAFSGAARKPRLGWLSRLRHIAVVAD